MKRKPALGSIVTYQRVHVYASQESPSDVGLVVLTARTISIQLDHFLSFVARRWHSAFDSVVTRRDVHEGAAIEPLTHMKPSVTRTHAEKDLNHVNELNVTFVSVKVNLRCQKP